MILQTTNETTIYKGNYKTVSSSATLEQHTN